jgi:hypothetical protein
MKLCVRTMVLEPKTWDVVFPDEGKAPHHFFFLHKKKMLPSSVSVSDEAANKDHGKGRHKTRSPLLRPRLVVLSLVGVSRGEGYTHKDTFEVSYYITLIGAARAARAARTARAARAGQQGGQLRCDDLPL